jgi:hypothetical protein
MGFDPANEIPVNSGTFPFAPSYYPRPLVVSAGLDKRFGLRFHAISPTSGVAAGNFSTTAVTLPPTATPSFKGPAYWPTTFNFPDPFYPRSSLASRIGAVATSTLDIEFDPVGVDLSVTPPTLIANPDNSRGSYNTIDEFYIGVSQDNVSNLDESGASL